MPLLEILKQLISDARQLHEKNKPVGWIERLKYRDADDFLNSLEQIARSEMLPVQYLNEIQGLLRRRWEKIGGTLLSYTYQHQHHITALCLQLGKLLHEHDQCQLIYQYMMPTLDEVSDYILDLFDNLDEMTLSSVILSSDQKSLIPAVLISYISHKGSVVPQMLVNPCNNHRLTLDELARLQYHSPESVELVEIFHRIQNIKAGNGSFGGRLQQLILDLRKGGAHGGMGGKENEASLPAMKGIIHFMEYWQFVPLERKLTLNDLKCKSETQTLSQLMAILNKTDNDTFDCVEAISSTLEKILEEHGSILFQETSSDWNDLENLYIKFEQLVQSLRKEVVGTDPVQGVSRALLLEYDVFQDINTLDDLIDLFRILTPEQLNESEKTLALLLWQIAPEGGHLKQLLQALTPQTYVFICSHLNHSQQANFFTFENLIEMIEQLTLAQLEVMLHHFQLPNIEEEVREEMPSSLASIFPYISENSRKKLIQLLGNERIFWLFTENLSSFTIGMNLLPDEICKMICTTAQENLLDLIANGAMLANFFKWLTVEKKDIFMESFFEMLPKIMKNGQQSGQVLKLLNFNQIEQTVMQLLKKAPAVIANGFEFCNMLYPLNEKQRQIVFELYRASLPALLKNKTHFNQSLRYLSLDAQKLLLSDIKFLAGIPQESALSDDELFQEYLKKRSGLNVSNLPNFFAGNNYGLNTIHKEPSQNDKKESLFSLN